MTKKERLAEIAWLESEIRYEEALGIHTYHKCNHCKKHMTRSGKCAWCIKVALEKLKTNTKD